MKRVGRFVSAVFDRHESQRSVIAIIVIYKDPPRPPCSPSPRPPLPTPSRRHEPFQLNSRHPRPQVQDPPGVPFHELYPPSQKSDPFFLLRVQLRGIQLADISSHARYLPLCKFPHDQLLCSLAGREHQRSTPKVNGTSHPICSRTAC